MLVLLGFVAISALLLLSEHRAHAYPIILVALLLLCPLLHMLMHGGHDRSRHSQRTGRDAGRPDPGPAAGAWSDE